MKYTEEQLIQLSRNNPQELIKIIHSSYNNINFITNALEILSTEIDDENIMLPTFFKLLKHINVSIRECALIGISCFYRDKKKSMPPELINKLLEISIHDPSVIIKDYIKDLIEV